MVLSAFEPSLSFINAITQAQHAVVTFTSAHDFTVGEWISFRISPSHGMIQLNNQKALVIAVSSLSVTINTDTTRFFAFVVPVTEGQTPAVAVPAGSGIIPSTYVPTVSLNDAFDNVRV